MFIGCQKFIIKKNFPLFMEHLPVAMGHKDLVRTSPTRIHNGKFFERVGELKNQIISIGCWLNGEADSLEVCNMVAQLGGRLCLLILGVVSKIHITQPQLGVSKRRKLGAVRPKHECNDSS
jgi:hypothetical protein